MIWLIGNKGMLGSDVSRELGFRRIDSLESDREVDITNLAAVREFSRGQEINWIVNCAAYTAVDRAEDEPDAAFSLNTAGVGCIAELAESNGARLIHVSTDYVFDGKASTPYPEDSPINPLGVYGRSKAAGERLALSRCSRSYITRTSWLFGPHGKNFVFTMLKLMKEREILKVVSDQVGSPTYTGHLAQAISTIIQADSQEYGIYHFANEGQCSWFDFAREICNLARKRGLISRSCTIQSCGTNDYPTKAKRPPYSVLSKAKIKRVFGVTIPSWQSALSAFFDRLVEEKML